MLVWRKKILSITLLSLLSCVGSMGYATSEADPPALKYVYPAQGSLIDEDNAFALLFNQAIKPESLVSHASCLVDGIGEQIPVRLLSEEERKQLFESSALSWLMDSLKGEEAETTLETSYPPQGVERIAIVQCTRQLPTDAKVTIAIAPGLEGLNGKISSKSFSQYYQVREPFKISFSCERVNPKAACSPLGDVAIQFNSPIPKGQAQQVQLIVDGKEVSPKQSSDDSLVYSLQYVAPFVPQSSIQVTVPKHVVDDSGRPLANADKFPLKTEFGDYPPLLKFATGDFGVIESYAHAKPGDSLKDYPALIPLTVRNVEKKLAMSGVYRSGVVAELTTQDDTQVRKWLSLLPQIKNTSISQRNFMRLLEGKEAQYQEKETLLDSRNLSALAKQKGVRQYQLPSLKNVSNETEVIGLPVKAPGFYVFEARSPRLGAQLTSSEQAMYVRTAALVTNMAVHLKTSDDGALVWVTRLDDAQVIPNAQVRLSDCTNQEIVSGKTDDQGVFQFKGKLPELKDCVDGYSYMASARIPAEHPMAYGVADYAFALSDWDKGIENWQFNVDNSYRYGVDEILPQLMIHPILGRTLLRAGETVHIKHLVRRQTANGITTPLAETPLPNKVIFSLDALDEEIELPLKWEEAPNGSKYAETIWVIPKTAKNGVYSIRYRENARDFNVLNPEAHFQIEEFKVPFLKGSIQASSEVQQGNVLVNPESINTTVQLAYISGGAAVELPVEISAMIVPSTFHAKDWEGVVFGQSTDEQGRKVFLNKKKIVLDTNGYAQVIIGNIPSFKGNADIVVEASFLDPNGQIQTISQTIPVMSSGIAVGIRGESYVEAGKAYTTEIVAVNALGEPQAETEVQVKAINERTHVVRKRLVGGFYAVDTTTTVEDLGTLCQGKTDVHGLLKCTLTWPSTGELTLTAQAQDEYGNRYTTERNLWVYQGFNWYAGDDTDRVDVVPNKISYQAGEDAVFDVKIPFREATALVSIEREGVMEYQVVNFDKNSSTFKLKIKPEWIPNVFVNVLSVRGRIRAETDDAGVAWVKDNTQAQGASTLIDLAKPSFRLGVAKIKVSNPESQMHVDISLDKPVYQVRDKVKLHITAKRANGDKVGQANVAVFVVDKALLELAKNNTDDVLTAMWPDRPWSVHTATAQGEVVGRRHYGRKAVPAGGGGGLAPTRELFDTLVFWKANVVLDQNGEADVEFKLNDNISQFEVVTVADDGNAVFGTQKADFATKQDLQIISGLPLLVRDTDKFDASITLHNATERDMSVVVKGELRKGDRTVLLLPEKTVSLLAGRSNKAIWTIEPLRLSDAESKQALTWSFEAKEQLPEADDNVISATATSSDTEVGNQSATTTTPVSATKQLAQDKIQVAQQLISYVPVTVRQSQLLQVPSDGKLAQLSVQAPTRALSVDGVIRGGIQVQIQKSLSASLSGVKRYFAEYPYSCFEQRASVAMGLQNQEAWQALMREANSYLDEAGFMRYYPSAMLQGSPLLTAYILRISADAKALGWKFEIPEAIQERMLEGLTNVVTGEIKQDSDWIPVADKTDYQLNLLATLARYNRVTESMLEAYLLNENYSEAGLVNLYAIHRVLTNSRQADILADLRQRILDKMSLQGNRLIFKNSTDLDNLWWLMDDSKSIHAKLLLAVVQDPLWKNDVPHLVQGLIATQVKGQWGMTTNNLLGSLAIHSFSQYFEKDPAEGEIHVSLQDQDYEVPQQWNGLSLNQSILIPWVDKKSEQMQLKLVGKGVAWATVSSLAAVEPVENTFSGYRVDKLIEPISRRVAGQWSVGDVYRVHLRITSEFPMNWVVVNDPIPSGASILGNGLGRDSIVSGQVDTQLANGHDEYQVYVEPSFVERKADVYRAYYRFVDKGELKLEYTVRLNNVGKFSLPATRVEAMYAPAVFGEAVNNDIQVKAP